MEDVVFIIVNAKDMRSQTHLPLLQSRVSFPVYQETEEEDVWDLMEGGKDDMYVYDKCGRLTYYIPFPLSIIHDEQPIVLASVLSTYFQSPCGSTCEENGTFANALDETVQEENTLNTDQPGVLLDVEDDFPAVTDTIDPVTGTIIEDTDNNTIYNETGLHQRESNDVFDESFNSTENQNTSSGKLNLGSENMILSVFKFIWGTKVVEEMTNSSIQETTNSSIQAMTNSSIQATTNSSISEQDQPSAENYTSIENTSLHFKHSYDGNVSNAIETDHIIGISELNTAIDPVSHAKNNVTPDKCLGADEKVCKDWSKRQLLHAQRCCAADIGEFIENSEEQTQGRNYRSCRKFGKKKCKKMQHVLKCCLKTEWSNDEEPFQTEKDVDHAM